MVQPRLARIAALLALQPVLLFAHDLTVSVRLNAPVVITRATYAGRDPASFVKVTIHAPSSTSNDYQSGNTDRNGYFSFVPAGPGNWRVVVDDELGHRKELTVSVPSPFEARDEAPVTGSSTARQALLGLALIVGITGFFYGYKSRSKN